MYNEGLFNIKHNKLVHDKKTVEFIQSPNFSGGFKPDTLLLHYTASPSMDSSINWFKNKNASASAHFIIDYDGKILQMVKTNQKAWHAGRSTWKGRTGLNKYSIGIEIVNYGHMDILSDGSYKTWFGKVLEPGTLTEQVTAKSGETYNANIIRDTHKLMSPNKEKAWVAMTPEQIESLIYLGCYLMKKMKLKEVLTHDQVSIKWDTGPLVNSSILEKIKGRHSEEGVEVPVIEEWTDESIVGQSFEVDVASYLNMRSSPEIANNIVGTLLPNDKVSVVSEVNNTPWVEVQTGSRAFVHRKFLKRL